jgi:hypothetical protein
MYLYDPDPEKWIKVGQTGSFLVNWSQMGYKQGQAGANGVKVGQIVVNGHILKVGQSGSKNLLPSATICADMTLFDPKWRAPRESGHDLRYLLVSSQDVFSWTEFGGLAYQVASVAELRGALGIDDVWLTLKEVAAELE